MGMGKGATGIRKEVAEKQSSILPPWRHATTLARAQREEEQKKKMEERAGARKIKIGPGAFGGEKDASGERMTQMSIADGKRRTDGEDGNR